MIQPLLTILLAFKKRCFLAVYIDYIYYIILLHEKSSADTCFSEGAPDLATRTPAAVVDTGGGRHVAGLKPLGPPVPLLGKHQMKNPSLSSCRVIIFYIQGHISGWMHGG